MKPLLIALLVLNWLFMASGCSPFPEYAIGAAVFGAGLAVEHELAKDAVQQKRNVLPPVAEAYAMEDWRR